jgi:hypothetical protein
VILFGNETLNDELRSGGRFTLGYWFGDCQRWALEGSYFFLGQRNTNFLATSDAFPLLARPFFNLNTNQEFSEISTRADLATGSVTIQAPTELWGAEINARRRLLCGCSYHLDALAGFRYLNLKDGLGITENLLTVASTQAPAGERIVVADHFDTQNQFYGGQLGLDGELRRGHWVLGMTGKVALGGTNEIVDINGGQVQVPAGGGVQLFQGGLLALNSNIGHFTRDSFAVVPEAGLKIGYQFTDHIRLSAGYTFLYWSNVLRSGDQIDRVIDIRQVPNFAPANTPGVTQVRPIVPFKETDFWAQGVTFSLELRY